MLQINKKFRQFICYMLVLAVVLSTVPFAKASASEGDSHLQEIVQGVSEVIGEQKEYAEEAELDAKSSYRLNDAPFGAGRSTEKSKNLYDDGNIPDIDLPQNSNEDGIAEPLPESTRPRKDESELYL